MDKARLPRVLYVLNVEPATKFGSLEEQVVFLERAFRAENSRFLTLFTSPLTAATTECWRERDTEIRCLDLSHFRPSTFFELWRLVGREGIDIVHWNMTPPLKNAYLWGLTLLRPTVRHIYTDHNSRTGVQYDAPTGWRKRIKRFFLKRYRQVWCVSQYVHDCLAALGTWPHLKTCLHFINTERFRADLSIRAALRRDHAVEDRFVITLIAQMIPEKGVDVAVRALSFLPEKAILWLVGTGAQADDFQALARQLGIERRVVFWGLQRNVEPFLQATDCFVLPSRWQEAAGLVILEAQAAGLPVVASRVGGIPEHIDEGKSGFLFSSGNERELADHLLALCNDKPLRRRMGEAARMLAQERFSPEKRLPDILNLYREALL
jgi:glycosyltransferase involved in cell wall biosynthesis